MDPKDNTQESAPSRWTSRLKAAFDKNGQANKAEDKSKKFIIVGVSAVGGLVIVLMLLSTPPTGKARVPSTASAATDHQPVQSQTLMPNTNISIIPELNPSGAGEEGVFVQNKRVTPEDIRRLTQDSAETNGMAANTGASPKVVAAAHGMLPKAVTQPSNGAPAALHAVSFTEGGNGSQFNQSLHDLEVKVARLRREQTGSNGNGAAQSTTAPTAEQLQEEQERKEELAANLAQPSMVYVHQPEPEDPQPAVEGPKEACDFLTWSGLQRGTRLAARLETALNTAVNTPVIAVVEYNYQKHGKIVVPAGAKLFGRVSQASRQGFLNLRFDSISLPDLGIVPISATALSLDYAALKGKVHGRNRVKKALVQAGAGVGTVAAQLVGGGFSGPLDRSFLIRNQISNNIATMGDRQLRELVLNERRVVTLPANTQIFVMLLQTANSAKGSTPKRAVARPQTAEEAAFQNTVKETLAELRHFNKYKAQEQRLIEAALADSTSP